MVTPVKTLRWIAGSFGAALLALLAIVVGGHLALAQTQNPLSLKNTVPGYDAAKSAKILSEDFAGAWRVTFAPEDKAFGRKKRESVLKGRAVVAADGSGVTLTLKGPDGEEHFESVETDAVRLAPGTGPFRALLTVRFKRIEAPSTGDGGADVQSGRRLVLPRSQNTASFVLADRPAKDRDGRTCTSQLNLSSKVAGKNRDRLPDNVQPGQAGATKKAVEPNPEDCAAPSLKLPVLWRDVERERLRVQIATRADPDRYEGTWTEELNKSFAGGGRTVWVRGDPAIAGVIVLDDQAQLAYPFKQDGKQVKGATRTRRLVLYGKHLPPLEMDDGKPVRIESGDKSIHYVLLRPSPVEKRRLLGEAQRIAKAATESAKSNAGAGKGASGRTETVLRSGAEPASKSQSAPERALDALKDGDAYFATAYLRKDITSGYKGLSISGAAAEWPLLFADQTALLHFTRHDDLARDDGVATFFPGDIGAVDVIFDTDIPHSQIYVELLVRHPDAEQPEKPRVLLAQRREDENPYYRTEPIHFVDAHDVTKRPPDDPKAVSLVVKKGTNIGARLIDATQALAVPLLTTATVDSDPGALGPLWEEALKRVAACEGAVWQGDPKYALKTSEKIYKVTVGDFLIKVASYTSPLARAAAELQGYDTSGPTRFDASTTLFVGDHAAALLIRDELVKALWRVQPDIKKVALGEIDTRGFRSMARRSPGTAGDSFWQDSVVTYVKKRVPWSFKNLFSGDLIRSMSEQSTVKLRLVETLDEAAIAKRFGTDQADARKWAEKATREAAGDLYAKVDAAIARASGNSCDLAELLVVAGQNPDPFVARLLPRLVKRKGVAGPPRVVKGKKVPGPLARQYWVADKLARGFVERLGTGAKTVRAIEQYAALDDAYKAMGVALVTAGAGAALTAGGYAGAGLTAALVGDTIDAAYFGVKGLKQYQRAEEFYEFAQGAAPVLGRDVLLTAEAQRENGVMAAVGAVLPGVGALSNMAQLRHLKHLDHLNTIKQGEKVFAGKGAKSLENFDKLPASDKTAMMAYYTNLVGQAQKSGLSSLSEADQKALGSFQDFVKSRGGTPPNLKPAPAKLASADPDATVTVPPPGRTAVDPEATVTVPGPVDGVPPTVTGIDPHKTLPPPGRPAGIDPEATVTVPGPVDGVPPTVTGVDPHKTLPPPGRPTGIDPEATVTVPGPVDGVPPTVAGIDPHKTLPPPGRPTTVDPEATVTVPGPVAGESPTVTATDPFKTAPSPGRTAGVDPNATVTVPGPAADKATAATRIDPTQGASVPGAKAPDASATPGTLVTRRDADLPPGNVDASDTIAPSGLGARGPPVQVTTDEAGDLVVTRLADGHELRLPPGDMRDGSFSQTYPVPGRPDIVAKFTSKKAGPAAKLDKMGYDVASTLDHRVVEVPKIQKEYAVRSSPIVRGEKGAKDFTDGTLRIIDRAPDDFKNANPATKMADGSMTPGQAIAFDRAMRALNKKGYAWLDNKYDNYAFKRIGDRGDDWKLVIVDTGGIVPMRDLDPKAARALQEAVDNPTNSTRGFYKRNELLGRAVHEEEIALQFDGLVDWNTINRRAGTNYRTLFARDAVGRAGKFPYNPMNGYRYPKTGTLTTAEDADAIKAAYEALRAAHPVN